MLENIEKELLLTKKEFSKYFFFSMSLLFLFYFILTIAFKEYSILLKDNKEFYLVGCISSGYIGYLLSKLEYDFIQMYRIIMLFVIMITIYLCLTHCYLSYSVYAYYVPISIFILILSTKKIAAFFAFSFLVLCFFTRSLAILYGFSSAVKIAPDLETMLLIIEIITFSISLYFSLFLIYYYRRFKKIEVEYNKAKGNNAIFISHQNILNKKNANFSKFDALYLEIINLLDKDKSYRNPELSESMMAESLNTNESYISKAINSKGNKNFNKLINEYRVNQIKEDFNKKKHEIYSIEYIYKNAGFKQRSTFNRVFKEFTGMNPSEYIESIK